MKFDDLILEFTNEVKEDVVNLELLDQVLSELDKKINGQLDEIQKSDIAKVVAALTMIFTAGVSEAEAASKTGLKQCTIHQLASNKQVKQKFIILNKKLDDKKALQATLYDEARGEGPEGIKHVLSVIVNRKLQNPEVSYRDIVTKKFQFSGWNDKKMIDGNGEIWDYCGKLAEYAINGQFKPINNYDYFYSGNKQPSWAKGKKVHKIGRQYFTHLGYNQ